MICIDSLWASFGSFCLRDITLRVTPASSLALLGPSGSGKSLLLETVLGLRAVASGQIVIDGRDVTRLPPERRDVSYLPQDVALFPHLSVRENILFGARSHKLKHEAAGQLQRLAELLNIGHLLHRRDVTSLSGGEAQRVALARALLVQPRVLCLDECFNALDAPLRHQLRIEFRQLQQQLGLTVLLTTHDQEEAFLLADQVALLMGGRLVQIGAPEHVYAHPASLNVARFLGIENILPLDAVDRIGSQTICSIGPLRLITSRPVDSSARYSHVAFAAEELRLIDGPDCHSTSARPNTFRARVQSAVNLGRRWNLSLQLLDSPELTLSCSVPSTMVGPTPRLEGEIVAVFLDQSNVRLLPLDSSPLQETTATGR